MISLAENSTLVVLKNCGFVFFKPIMEKYEINKKTVIGRNNFVDRVTKTLLTPSGRKNIRDTK